jgi:mono/diheme cytochrome c family protein
MIERNMRIVAVIVLALLLAGCGAGGDRATEDPELAHGRRLFQQHCASCHAVEPERIVVGPSLAGIAVLAENRIDGLDAEAYLAQAILDPEIYLVEGFPNLMPTNFDRRLRPGELDALLAYLLTLEK